MANPTGRPSKLTKEIINKLKELIEKPSFAIYTDEDISTYLDIDRGTFENWVGAREDVIIDNDLKAEFSALIKKGRLTQKSNLHDEMRAGENGWQAKAWILERKFGDLNLRNISEVKQTNHNINASVDFDTLVASLNDVDTNKQIEQNVSE